MFALSLSPYQAKPYTAGRLYTIKNMYSKMHSLTA